MTVVFLDTETTGLDPERHEVFELGFISGGQESRYWLPVDLRRADPNALRFTHYYERAQHEEEADPRMVAGVLAVETDGAHLVGAVPSFDEAFLTRFLRKHGYAPAWHYHLVDVEAMAAGKLGTTPPWDSDALSKAVGVDPEQFERHTALGDARWAKAIYEACTANRQFTNEE